MLRFERKSRNREVSISLRSHEKKLNRLSLMAFGLAIGVHSIGFLIFHVAPFKISSDAKYHSPVVVKSDLSHSPEASVYAIFDETHDVSPKIAEPTYSKPKLPRFPRSQNISYDPGEL